jgi:glycyl-tRNA synthetase beta chain
LFTAMTKAQEAVEAALKNKNYTGAMAAMAPLRPVIDAFFEAVTVNTGDENLRINRLRLLKQVPQALYPVADFDDIAG